MKQILSIFLVCIITHKTDAQEIMRVKITDVGKIIAESKGPLIINMWATWCKPCIEEIPYFISEVDQHNATVSATGDSISMLLVSLDFKEAYPNDLTSFVKKRKYAVPVVWLDETNADYFCPFIDEKWSGAIPATLFVNHKTGYRNFYEKQLSHEELKKEIMAILKN